jgi:hypothetical protein
MHNHQLLCYILSLLNIVDSRIFNHVQTGYNHALNHAATLISSL